MPELPLTSYTIAGRHASRADGRLTPRFVPLLDAAEKHEDGSVTLRVACGNASDFWMHITLTAEAIRLLAEPPQ